MMTRCHPGLIGFMAVSALNCGGGDQNVTLKSHQNTRSKRQRAGNDVLEQDPHKLGELQVAMRDKLEVV